MRDCRFLIVLKLSLHCLKYKKLIFESIPL